MSNKNQTPVTVVEPVKVEAAAEVVEVVETPSAPVVAPVKGKSAAYVAVEGDTFASIAARFKPEGMTKHLYAVHLSLLNGGTLRPGSEVKL